MRACVRGWGWPLLSIQTTTPPPPPLQTVELLVREGAVIGWTDKDARSALAYTSRRGHVDIGQWLLDRGLPASQCDVHGLTPLHQAVLARSVPMVEILLRAGADILARDSNGLVPYKLAKRFLSADHPSSADVVATLQKWIAALATSEEKRAAGMSSTSVAKNSGVGVACTQAGDEARAAAAAEVAADLAEAQGARGE